MVEKKQFSILFLDIFIGSKLGTNNGIFIMRATVLIRDSNRARLLLTFFARVYHFLKEGSHIATAVSIMAIKSESARG